MTSATDFRDTFFGQFLLSPADRQAPAGFHRYSIGKWNLNAHSALPVHRLLNENGAIVGFVLGYPIREGALWYESNEFRLPSSSVSSEAAMLAFLNEMSGRYLVILLENHPLAPRIYPDAFASLSIVYSAEQQIAASTTSLLDYREGVEPRYPIGVYPDVGFYYYPAGLTDLSGCSRLLPNHELDLSTWESHRFWPKIAFFPCAADQSDVYVNRAIEAVRSNLVATAVRPLTYGGLTAGRDSRVLLACTPPEIRNRTEYITFNYPNRSDSNQKDMHIAKILAKRHNLRHRVLNVQNASSAVRSSYFYRIGRAGGTGKASDFFQAAIESLEMGATWLTGFGGEVSCMYYAIDEDRSNRPSAADLLNRIDLREDHGCLAAVSRWLEKFPADFPDELLVELFYIENRVGSWACPHLYGAAPFLANIIPYCDRRYVEACLRMPYAFRRSRASQVRMIQLADPSLLETPFEALTGLTLWKRRLLRNRFFDLSKWI